MRSEREKMLAGEFYDPLDPELVRARDRARDLCQALNATREAEQEERRRIVRELFGTGGESVWMQPPFYCDYGANIHLGERVFFNFNCVVLDVCEVRIGDYTMFGPSVQIYTATHPLNAESAPHPGVRQADHHRPGRLGRRRRGDLPRRDHRRPRRHRRRQRRHPRRPRFRLRRRQPLPRHPGADGVGGGSMRVPVPIRVGTGSARVAEARSSCLIGRNLRTARVQMFLKYP